MAKMKKKAGLETGAPYAVHAVGAVAFLGAIGFCWMVIEEFGFSPMLAAGAILGLVGFVIGVIGFLMDGKD